MEGKIECLKRIDRRIVRPMKEYFDASGCEHRILIVPDHRRVRETVKVFSIGGLILAATFWIPALLFSKQIPIFNVPF